MATTDPAKKREMVARRNRKRREDQRLLIAEAREGGSCADCGNGDPRVLDFHHRDPADKSFKVSGAANLHKTYKQLIAEIAKCELLCANCHRIRHADGS